MKKLLSLGITDQLKDYRVPLVRNANLFSFITAIFSIVFTVFLLFYSSSHAVYGLIFLIPALLTWLFNYLKWTKASGAIFLIFTSMAIVINHAHFSLNGETILYFLLFQFNMFILIGLLIDPREKLIFFGTAIILVFRFFSFDSMYAEVNSGFVPAVMHGEVIKGLAIAINFIIGVVALYAIKKKYVESERAYIRIREELDDKLKELEHQQTELNNTLSEIEKSHKEDDKRNWVSNGLAKINNILRSDSDDIYKKVLVGVIDYVHLLYGGIYEIEENDHKESHINLLASYGFDKEKIQKKRYSTNEGILGNVYHEKSFIYYTEIPEEYSSIESGLGGAKPKSMMIVPMIYEGHIEGIIEVASFRQLEDQEREFINKVAIILARFMESYKNEQQTKILLEKTQQQTEEMRAQEEEMRQNMEELQATQEELHRKEREYISRIKSLEEELE